VGGAVLELVKDGGREADEEGEMVAVFVCDGGRVGDRVGRAVCVTDLVREGVGRGVLVTEGGLVGA